MSSEFYFDAQVVEVAAEPVRILPVLRVTVDIKASSGGVGIGIRVEKESATDIRVDIVGLTAYLFWNPESERHMTWWPDFAATGFPRSTRISTIEVGGERAARFDLLFPLTPHLLSQMEETRPGDKVRYGVSVRMSGMHSWSTGPASAPSTPIFGQFSTDKVDVHGPANSDPVLELERSKWVEEILPGLGLGHWMVYEIPVENFEGAELVDTYLQNALRQFAAHEWKLCVAASRDVVESLERELRAAANPVYRDAHGTAEQKIQAVADSHAELVKATLGFQAATKSLLAAGAHPERAEEWIERPDAELALWIALTLRRYVGMRLRQTRPPPSQSINSN